MARETPHFKTSPIWDYSEALRLESSKGGKVPHPSRRILLLNTWTFLSRWWTAAGELSAQVRRNPPRRMEEGGLITPLGGTRRGMDQQEPGIAGSSDCLVHRSMSMLGLRKEICEGHLGGVSPTSQGKLLPVISRGFLG